MGGGRPQAGVALRTVLTWQSDGRGWTAHRDSDITIGSRPSKPSSLR